MTTVNHPEGSTAESRRWPLPGRIGFRFLSAYLVLSGLGFPIGWLPFAATRAFGQWYLDATIALSRWTQIHLLGVAAPLPFGFTGSTDTMHRYAASLGMLLLAAVVTVLWTLLDRHRPNYSRLSEWLRVWLRFSLATTLFGYGFAKLIQTQFPTPPLDRYVQPLGEFSPMGLLWTFMGHSPGYNVFTGMAEVLGALLLLSRRTATLGALILVGVLSNVLVLNLSYDVPVKLSSLSLLLTAVVIAAPDLSRVIDVLVRNRPTRPRLTRPLFAGRPARLAASTAVALFMGYIIWSNVTGGLEATRSAGQRVATAVLYGIYEVEDFRRNHTVVPPLLSDSLQWRRLIFTADGRVTLRTLSDSVLRYRAKVDTLRHSLELSIRSAPTETLTLGFEKDRDHLVLWGLVSGDSVTARLRRVDETKYLLVSRGFNWIQEQPFNR